MSCEVLPKYEMHVNFVQLGRLILVYQLLLLSVVEEMVWPISFFAEFFFVKRMSKIRRACDASAPCRDGDQD